MWKLVCSPSLLVQVLLMLKKMILLIGCCVGISILTDATTCEAVPREAEKQLSQAIADARRAIEAAEIRLRLYENVEYPRQVRKMEREIALTSAEVDRYRELLAEYKQITYRTIPEPLIVTRQSTELALLEAELRLKDLREENLALIRFHADQHRLYELEIESAEARLRALLSQL